MISENFKSLVSASKELDSVTVPNVSTITKNKRQLFYPMIEVLKKFLDSLSLYMSNVESSLSAINDSVEIVHNGILARMERIRFLINSSINASNGGISSNEELILPRMKRSTGVVFLREGRGYILK